MREVSVDIYNSALSREPFLFYEMRTTAKLVLEGLNEKEIIARVADENLFQYPTEKAVLRIIRACLRRLYAMEDETLVAAIARQPSDVSKQICLYAMMKQNRIIREFMTTVIGEKYRIRDFSYGKIDMNSFFMRLQEQNEKVGSWGEVTVGKIKQVITRSLVETEYLDSIKAEHINPVLIQPILENAIRDKGEQYLLSAFNCFS